MNHFCKWAIAATALTGWSLMTTSVALALDVELEPVSFGDHRVACSNLEQDFSRTTASPRIYWDGSRDQRYRYVSELLSEPEQVVHYRVVPPNDRNLFTRFRNSPVDYVALVCYPTAADNPRVDYMLPTGVAIPAMQRGSEQPIFFDACDVSASDDCDDAPQRWPLLVYSHGLGGSPLSDSYLSTMQKFASHGYIVAAPFHADPRFSRVQLRDLSDFYYLISRHDEVVEMQAIRPLAISALIDTLLEHPDYVDHIDADRIAGFGASLGGQTMMLVAGAELTYSLDRDRKQIIHDERLKAVVTYVPYSGIDVLPAFGSNQRGTRGVNIAYLGVAGTADDIAPLGPTREAVERLTGTRYLVAVKGLGHGTHPEVMSEAYAWYLAFLDANLNGDRDTLSQLYRATHVAGGMDDYLEIAIQGPVASQPGETIMHEFFHAGLGHYFRTAGPVEAGALMANPEWGWAPTHNDFVTQAASIDSPDVLPVCRFYGDPAIGPNSHFYTAWAAECDFLRALEAVTPHGQPAWRFEGIAFQTHVPDASGQCPDTAPFPVWRVYNRGIGAIENGRRKDPNHRFVTDRSIANAHIAAGWADEGIAFCTVAPVTPTLEGSAAH